MHLDRDEALRRAIAADHAILATLNRTGAADLVPVCFAIVGDVVAIPIDSVKPKGSTALGRVRNLERDPRATLLRRALGRRRLVAAVVGSARASQATAEPAETLAALLERALRERYPQYADDAVHATS